MRLEVEKIAKEMRKEKAYEVENGVELHTEIQKLTQQV
jgi:hypothetical protein